MRLDYSKYNQGDGVLEVIFRDESGKKEATLRANQSDKKGLAKISRLLLDKYNIDLTPAPEIKEKEGFFDF